MARSLKIPLFFHPAAIPYCGPACLKMVLAFYGIRISLANLVKLLPMTKAGIDLCSMGIFLKSPGSITVFIDRDIAYAKRPVYKKTVPLFVKAGGLLKPRAIRITDIRKALANGHPIILNIGNGHGGGHYVVVRHIGKKRMRLNNPDPLVGEETRSIKRVMSDCHNWTGGAIVIRPNRRYRR